MTNVPKRSQAPIRYKAGGQSFMPEAGFSRASELLESDNLDAQKFRSHPAYLAHHRRRAPRWNPVKAREALANRADSVNFMSECKTQLMR